MAEEILNTLKALVLPKLTAAQIATVKSTAEIGSLFYDTTNNKLNIVINGGNIQVITSA